MDFKENELINDVLINYYETFNLMLDTPDFVPDRVNNYISKFLAKRLRKKLREVKKEYKKYVKLKKKDLDNGGKGGKVPPLMDED